MRPLIPIAVVLLVAFAVLFVSFSAVGAVPGGRLLVAVLFELLVGWTWFLAGAFARVEWSAAGFATAAACLLLAGVGLHSLCAWLASSRTPADSGGEPALRRWRPRSTAALLGLFVLMFAAGICFVGAVHQAGWLISGRHPLAQERTDLRGFTSGSNLQQVGLGIQFLESAHGPQRSPFLVDRHGRPVHSWQTLLLGYMSIMSAAPIDFELPWDHPQNAPAFCKLVISYLNPSAEGTHDDRGFGLSHYAANVHAFGADRLLDEDDSSRRIVFGETAGGFRAWGDPLNVRDPLVGINRSEGGFGSPSRSGALCLFSDGSIQQLSNDIDPEVLRLLSVRGAKTGRARED